MVEATPDTQSTAATDAQPADATAKPAASGAATNSGPVVLGQTESPEGQAARDGAKPSEGPLSPKADQPTEASTPKPAPVAAESTAVPPVAAATPQPVAPFPGAPAPTAPAVTAPAQPLAPAAPALGASFGTPPPTLPPAEAEPEQDPTEASKPAAEQPILGAVKVVPFRPKLDQKVSPLYRFNLVIGLDGNDYHFVRDAVDEQDAKRQVIDINPALSANITKLRYAAARESFVPVNVGQLTTEQIDALAVLSDEQKAALKAAATPAEEANDVEQPASESQVAT